MISPNMPPLTNTGFTAGAGAANRHGADMEVTPDVIEMGALMGCPHLAAMRKPEFGAGECGNEGGLNMCKSGTAAAASASVAGGFGMAGIAGACPHMTSKDSGSCDEARQAQQQQ